MRILMINVVCGIRSTGRICTDLATALEKQGHEVKIAYGRENVPKQFQKYAIRIGKELDVKLHGIKARLFDGCGFGSRIATLRFIEWVKEYNPEVIHLHNLHGYYINVEVLFNYLRICGKKIIWTLHDCWAFTGHSAYCDAISCEKWVDGCHDCSMLKEYPTSFIDRSKKNWEKKKSILTNIPNLTIVTPSQWLAGLVKKSFFKNYPIKIINNGIDITQFYPIKNDFRTRYGVGNRFIVLGVSTSWNKMKGYYDYLKLAEILGDQYCVVLVGLNKKQKHSLPKNVLGIERTNSIKELVYLYSSANLFLNLSYCENYPTVNLEAVACGIPVLTYNTGGSPESAINGCIVQRGDLNEIVSKIAYYRESKTTSKNIHINRVSISYETTTNNYLRLLLE